MASDTAPVLVDTLTDVFVLNAPERVVEGWSAFVVDGADAGEALPLVGVSAAGVVLRVEKAALWRHAGGELAYARPTSAELILLIAGRAEILTEDSRSAEVTAGQLAIVPRGFVGAWRTLDPVLKLSIALAIDVP